MAHINLLPWRDTLKREREIRFGIAAGVALAFSALVWLGAHTYMQGKIDYQNSRNTYLKEQIVFLDKQIEEIKDLEKRRQSMEDRMRVIQELESSRSDVVHLFQEILDTKPDGVSYSSLAQKGDKITLSGKAQSNARVSSLMVGIEQSQWLTSPDIQVITRVKGGGKKNENGLLDTYEFTLGLSQTRPKKAGDDDDDDKESSS